MLSDKFVPVSPQEPIRASIVAGIAHYHSIVVPQWHDVFNDGCFVKRVLSKQLAPPTTLFFETTVNEGARWTLRIVIN